MARKTTDELIEIAKNARKEPEVKVQAALAELKNRGFDTTEHEKLFEQAKERKPKPDENSPTLYSKRAIYVFSALFSVLFGAAMFITNLKETDKRKGIFPVIAFAFLWIALTIYLGESFNLPRSASLILSLIGAIFLSEFFWEKYIGNEVVYHKRSVKKPLIIALIIFVPLTAFIIWAMIVAG